MKSFSTIAFFAAGVTFMRVGTIFLSCKIIFSTAAFLEAGDFTLTITISTIAFSEAGVTFARVNEMLLPCRMLFSTIEFLVACILRSHSNFY